MTEEEIQRYVEEAKRRHWISVPSAGRIIQYKLASEEGWQRFWKEFEELVEGAKLMPRNLCRKAEEIARRKADDFKKTLDYTISSVFGTLLAYKPCKDLAQKVKE